jgi:hypothetical protein
MPKKHIKTDGRGNPQELGKVETYKAKPKAWKESDFLRNYRLARERVLWQLFPDRRADIEQYVIELKEQWKKQDRIK